MENGFSIRRPNHDSRSLWWYLESEQPMMGQSRSNRVEYAMHTAYNFACRSSAITLPDTNVDHLSCDCDLEPVTVIPIRNEHVRLRADALFVFGEIDRNMTLSLQQLHSVRDLIRIIIPRPYSHRPPVHDALDEIGSPHQSGHHHRCRRLRIPSTSIGEETESPVWKMRLVDNNRLSTLQMADWRRINDLVKFPALFQSERPRVDASQRPMGHHGPFAMLLDLAMDCGIANGVMGGVVNPVHIHSHRKSECLETFQIIQTDGVSRPSTLFMRHCSRCELETGLNQSNAHFAR